MHFSSPEKRIWHWFPIMLQSWVLPAHDFFEISCLSAHKNIYIWDLNLFRAIITVSQNSRKGAQNQKQHAQMHFAKQAKSIRAACSSQNHNKRTHLIADFCVKDRGPVRKKVRMHFSPVPKCIQLFSLWKSAERARGVAHVERKTKRIFQAWQNAFGSVWSAMSFGLSSLHYSMKNTKKKQIGVLRPTSTRHAFLGHSKCIFRRPKNAFGTGCLSCLVLVSAGS